MKNSRGEAGDRWIALAASEIGTSHKRKDLPCQDASRVDITRAGLVIGAVADGIGSAQHSDVGSRLAVNAAVEYLLQHGTDLLASHGRSARDHCRHALKAAAQVIKAHAEKQNGNTDDYACTLLMLLAAPDWLAALSVGDGFVVWRPASSDEHEVLIPPDKTEFVNYTHSITSSDIMETCRFELRSEPPAFGLVSTDGLLYLVLENETWKPHPPFFNFIETYIVGKDINNDTLRKLLADPQINALTDDDKTLLLACSREHVPSASSRRAMAGHMEGDRSSSA